MRIDRMLSIVVILLNRRKITAKELADRFEVSLRTVYRDIESINMAGIPVISNQGTHGGYEIPENYKLNRQYLSLSDLRSILSALKGINAALDDRDIELIFEKVQSLLPENEKSFSAKGAEVIVFDTLGWGNQDKSAKKIQQLYDAVKSSRLVEISYVDSHGKSSVRDVEPMTIIQKGFSWYLFGFCRNKKAARLFKLTRIKQITGLSDRFERKPVDYREMNEKWKSSGKMIEVVLKFSASVRHLVADHHDASQVLFEDGESIIVKQIFPEGEWLIGMILSYGNAVEVLSPESVRRQILNKINKMASVYLK
ncbi:MAG: YafY family transcriptional regulator [Proteobacteria bacterium]|nr:YafY family transcriptional regulator [Pseudomonadota bacterium]MBU1582273.1 YafY family transcriptional regulator [Pseudomonadota bacterium]MBU2455091.1 YafY family transcriptional regulator [Pseudomonadota bacterium]MBU2628192.1 YafY family transcriptional regulator [Pseudomonadota bacterium]